MGEDRPSDADAVIYLMRHLHRADADFLGAFLDRSVAASSPVNAVAVLARADEIGACRLDAMQSASRIAARYQADPVVRALCTHVTAMAGLLAETGLTLREDEAAALRHSATTAEAELDEMLLSADGFCASASSDLTVELRRDLLDRLGLFGLRLVIEQLRFGRRGERAPNSRVYSSRLRVSPSFAAVIEQRFLTAGADPKGASAIAALRDIARSSWSRFGNGARTRCRDRTRRVGDRRLCRTAGGALGAVRHGRADAGRDGRGRASDRTGIER